MAVAVADLEPVSIDGWLISNVEISDVNEIREKDLRPGDQVGVSIGPDSEAEITHRVPAPEAQREGAWTFPDVCQCPMSAPILRDPEDDTRWCSRVFAVEHCHEMVVRSVEHYCRTMGITELTESRIRYLVEQGYINDVADIYELDWDSIDFREAD